uniref:Uncharacterized protein n=1 Tax=Oryza barthii TaxID=65489 RepID=A0A0D3FSI4_9ORYZ
MGGGGSEMSPLLVFKCRCIAAGCNRSGREISQSGSKFSSLGSRSCERAFTSSLCSNGGSQELMSCKDCYSLLLPNTSKAITWLQLGIVSKAQLPIQQAHLPLKRLSLSLHFMSFFPGPI